MSLMMAQEMSSSKLSLALILLNLPGFILSFKNTHYFTTIKKILIKNIIEIHLVQKFVAQ